jgi:iron(III) transport system permease protein
VNQRLISLVTVAVLLVLVALPLLFIVLQAVFPHLAPVLYRAPFPGYAAVFEPQLPAMLGGTLQIAAALRC